MRWTKIFRCALLLFMVAILVCDVGCAREYIASKIQSEVIRQFDMVDIVGLVGMLATGLMGWISLMVRTYIKNAMLQQAILEVAHKYEKDLEMWLIGQGKWVIEGLKSEIGELDFTKPLVPQLTQDAKDLLNKMKHIEVVKAVSAKTGDSEAIVSEKVKAMAPMINASPVAPNSVTEPRPVSSFRSAETQIIIEKLREKIAKG